ncbi:Ig-like protein group 2 [Microterricola gilva]|uniref:Ig-like protein group 2 n=1 Tax=Microterricola gilva TaxID=393267 RepID=A0A4Q8ANS3_9MICO|nr:discoidin domain-containing protein [Microterricola gilva]RZU65645.1 Ig-like protein group 2 [Microterricola gilva]
MKLLRDKPLAVLGAAALVSTTMVFGASVSPALAQQATGTAPFINSWLVSGPFDSAVADGIYGCEVAEVKNLAPTSTVTASSSMTVNPPAQLVDGNLRKQWVTENDSAPRVTLTWASPIALNEVRLAQWGDSRHVNEYYEITFTLADGSVVTSPRVTSTSAAPSSPTTYIHESTLRDVVAMSIDIDPGLSPYPAITGLSEIEVYQRAEPAEGSEAITPVVGGALGDAAESSTWEYFDDRVYNRNYDDYQDLSGYFEVKRGEDTRNKFVYAHSYVYSPEAKKAFVNVGASGSYRLYVNDNCVTAPSTPVEVQKDLTRQEVQLKAGWNKVLLQIEHTYTEDLNANGVPVAKDQNVAYLGFYGRISDASGNRVDGILTSVAGPSKKLRIDTQPLSSKGADKGALPKGALPTGYLEWPYVWNKSTTGNSYGVSASPFQFLASGGKPGYTWELIDGELPKGLELNPDGTIADGLVDGAVDLSSTKGIISPDARIGDYTFTLRVTDGAGATAKKQFTLTVQDRPNRKFEEGRVSALTHSAPIYNYFVDPNYSVDQWAARAKAQGLAMVSLEALQQNYHWPSKFSDPAGERQKYLPKAEDGNVVDGLKPMVDAIRRYGMDVGMYYATEGGGLQHFSTDVFVQNVEDLLDRYDPSYLYFDGPQTMPGGNYDVMYSAVRNRSADVVIDSNAWGEEYGDPDIRTDEASHIYANTATNHLVKRTPMEPWKILGTRNQDSPYYPQRDDFRLVAQETIMNAGRGYVDNNDQTVNDGRGPNWHSPTEMATRYPKGAQEFIEIRDELADWYAPAPGINLLESVSGTTPFFLPGYGYEDDGLGNAEKFAFPTASTGPQWGYATHRDNNIYLHIIAGPDGKKGFDAIQDGQLTVGGITDKVTSVTLLNDGSKISSTQNGEELALDLSDVSVDPVDTIIKIETRNKARTYALTDVTVDAHALDEGRLQLEVGGYMTYPALPAELDQVKYKSSDKKVVAVGKDGLIAPGADGSAEVTVSVKAEGVKKSTTVTVSVLNGIAYIGEELSSAVLRIEGKETFGTFTQGVDLGYTVDGRSAKGQSIRLDAADVTWHAGVVDLDGGTKTEPIAITEVNSFGFAKGKLSTPQVTEATRMVVWGEAALDGKTVTTNRVFFDLLPTRDVAPSATITTSDASDAATTLSDGIIIDAGHPRGSGWSAAADGASWAQFDLAAPTELSSVDLAFNEGGQQYVNTPRTIVIQTSVDGETWTDAHSASGPSGSVFWGAFNSYPLTGVAQHVRVAFPDGSAGAAVDLLEVRIQAAHEMTGLAGIEAAPQLGDDARTATVDIAGRSFQGDAVSVPQSAVSILSDNVDVASVSADGLITGAAKGQAKITVNANLDGYRAMDFFYVEVDADGRLSLPGYAQSVQLSLSGGVIRVGEPVVATVETTLNTGAAANPAETTTTFEFSDPRLAQVGSSNTIVLTEPVTGAVQSTVRVSVTYGGQTITSDPVQLTATGENIASSATVTVSSVRDANGVPNGDNQDARYVGSKAVDSDKASSWASKQTDVAPWIKLEFSGPVQIDRVNLVDRGHEVNQIAEGLLEWEGGSKLVTGIAWNGQPDNIIKLDAPVTTSWLKFTLDPNNTFDNQALKGEVGLAEFSAFGPAGVKSIVEASAPPVTTAVGQQPELPAELDAVYSDGSTGSVGVDWESVPADKLAKPGWFTFTGSIAGTDVNARVVVTVQ